MARNKVEYHIQAGAFHTFKVQAGETLFIGQPVAIRGDMTVGLANEGEEAIGVVYAGNVAKDGVNEGYKGDDGDIVTVVMNKPIVYLTAGGAIPAGGDIQVGANGKFIHRDGTTNTGAVIAKALTTASADGDFVIAYLK